MNIYQELFTTKISEKIWSSSVATSAENKSRTNLKNEFSESFFEKTALKEFETSIYNQMSCSKILSSYYEQIIRDEKVTINTRFSMLSSVSQNDPSKSQSNSQSSSLLVPQISINNLRKGYKHLSLNIFDSGLFT